MSSSRVPDNLGLGVLVFEFGGSVGFGLRDYGLAPVSALMAPQDAMRFHGSFKRFAFTAFVECQDLDFGFRGFRHGLGFRDFRR